MELVAFLGNDQESWGQITGLINHGEWEKVILVKNKHAESYVTPEGAEQILVDTTKPVAELKKELQVKLQPFLSGLEANVTIASGTGKEHMALIGALLTIPVGIKLVAFTKNGIEFLT